MFSTTGVILSTKVMKGGIERHGEARKRVEKAVK